jgi:sugar lactone lactonase YvrE
MRLHSLVWIPAFLAASLAATASAANLPPAANTGIQWLQTQVNADGSLANEALSIAAPLQARSETATALGLVGQIPTSLTGAVASDTGTDTESLSRHVIALVEGGQDPSAAVQALYANQNADGGFGSLAGDSSDPLDTAFALLALRTANNASAANLSNALLYMVGAVGADGGYGLPAGGSGSQDYVTSYVLLAYQAYATSYPLTQQISGARHWLITQQAGGVYNDTLSSALGVLALASTGTDASTYVSALTQLGAGQASDGSWGEDPYLTALALRAIAATATQAQTPPPTVGAISGQVLDSSSHLPITSAQVALAGPSSVTVSVASDGSFNQSNLAPGTYSAAVGASGYASLSLQGIKVTAGSTTSLGTLVLQANPTTANITGRITDGSTGLPLAGVQVSVSGAATASTTSAVDGSYNLSGIATGSATLSADLAGYNGSAVDVTLGGGESLTFSPALYPTGSGSGPTTATFTGTVSDAMTKAPIAGASVTVGSATAQTDGAGRFSIANLVSGTFQAVITAPGYSEVDISGTLANGTNSAGSVYLSVLPPVNNFSAASGVITISGAGTPLAGATVLVTGTGLSAITESDGSYQIGSIPGAQFSLYISAPGYVSQTANINLGAPGTAVANAALTANLPPPATGGVVVDSVTATGSYDPYSEIDVDADIDNTSASAEKVVLTADLIDAQGTVIYEVGTVMLAPGQVPVDPSQTIAANGSLAQGFDFHLQAVPAGTYQAVVNVTDAQTGAVLAQKGTAVTVNALAQVGGGLTLSPPILQAGTGQPVSISGTAYNEGNLPLGPTQLQLTVNLAGPSSAAPSVAQLAEIAGGTPLSSPKGSAQDAVGDTYIVNSSDRKVIQITPTGVTTVLATLPSFFKVNGTNTTIAPVDTAVDAARTVWVLSGNNLLCSVDIHANQTCYGTGMTGQDHFTLDQSGNFYITGTVGTDHVLAKWSVGGTLSVLVRNGLAGPMGIAADSAGNLYVANYGDNTVSRVDASGAISNFVTGLSAPQGLAIDAANNLYIANSGANDILKVTSAGAVSVFASGMNNPFDLQFDPQGDLLVSNTGNSTISKVSPAGVVSNYLENVALNPEGLKYDSQGNMYIANTGNNALTEVDASGAVHTLSIGLNSPRGIAIDPAGSIYVANNGAGTIGKVTGSSTSTFASGFKRPYGLTWDGLGNLVMTDSSTNRFTTLAPDGTVVSTMDNMLAQPTDAILGLDGSIIVANNAFISHVPLAGGGTVLGSTATVVGLTQGADGTVYYTTNNSLNKLSNGKAVQIATILSTLSPPAVDAAGNLYVGDNSNKRIVRYNPAGTSSAVYATLPGSPGGMVLAPNGVMYVVVGGNTIYTVATNGAAVLLTTLTSGLKQLALDSAGRLLVTNGTAGTVLAVAADGTSTTLLTGLSSPNGVVPFADGSLAVVEAGQTRIRVFAAGGSLTQSIYGYSGPEDILWDGTRFIFSTSGNTLYTVAPGGYPQLLKSNQQADYLLLSGSSLYCSMAGGVSVVNLSTNTSTIYYQPDGAIAGLAFRPDGDLTVAIRPYSQIRTLNSSKQVVSSYVGVTKPLGLALDSAGDLFVADQGINGIIIEFNAAGNGSQVVTGFYSPEFLRFDPAGNLYVSGSQYLFGTDGIYKVNLSTGAFNEVWGAAGSARMYGFLFQGGTVYGADNYYEMVRDSSGSSLNPFAVGTATPRGVRIGPDNALYLADYQAGVVLRYNQSALSLYAAGLVNPESLDFDASGNLFVGGTGGSFVEVDAHGNVTDAGLSAVLTGDDIQDMHLDSTGAPVITLDGVGAVDKVQLAQSVKLPLPGTQVYAATTSLPALSTGDTPVDLSFGSWTPQYGGDYTFTVSAVGASVTPSFVSTMHVGPHAEGQLTANAQAVPPGAQPVGLTLAVQGLDFTTLAAADASNLQIAVSSGVGPSAMGEDPAGTLWVVGSGKLMRFDSQGNATTITNVTGLNTSGPQLPIDSAGKIYLLQGNFTLLKYDPTTNATSVAANLPTTPRSMAMAQDGKLYYLTSNGSIYLVNLSTGTTTLIYAGISNSGTLTIDGAGTLWVETFNQSVLKITPDGTASTALTNAGFEYEGDNNIAGDCADNLLLTQGYEEGGIYEVVGSTGQHSLAVNAYALDHGLGDMDFITFDRFHSQLLIWTDDTNGRVYRLPILCGAIDVEAHMVATRGQTLSGFNVAPTATLNNADGTTDYVWDMKNVTALGQNLQFGTTLNGLQIGQSRGTLQAAYLDFKNTFLTTDVTLPLTIPGVQVAPAATMNLGTDAPSYAANTPVNVTAGLIDSFSSPISGNLDIQVTDASNDLVADLGTQPASIPGGSTLSLGAAWNTGTILNGNYTAQAVLTAPDGTVLAKASAPFAIGTTSVAGGNAVLTVGVTTDKAAYAPTATVMVDDRLANATSNAIADSISFTTTVTNPDGSVRWTNTSTLAELVPGGLRDITFPLALQDAAPGTYGVSVAASLDGTALTPATASFTVQSSADTASGVTGTVAANPVQVPVTGTVALSGNLSNGGNAALNNVTATLAVLDPVSGTLVFQSPVSIASFAQGQSMPLQAAWIAAGNAGRTYVAVLMVSVGGVSKTVAQANFSLVDPTAGLSGTLMATPVQVPLTTNLSLAGSVSNAAAAISGVTSNITIRDAGGNVVFQSPAGIGALAQGGSAPVQATWTATGAANQSYTATLTATVAGYTRTLAQTSFTVLPPPDPTVNLTGSLTVSPAQVQVGASLALNASVSDTGASAVSGIVATLVITDPIGQTVLTSPITIANLSVGQTSQLVANWVAAGTVNTTFTATLTVTAGGKSKLLAQQTFQVVPPPVSMTASLALGQHGRVLILTDALGNSDPNGPSGAPGITAQNQHLASVLSAAGWSYKIVTNADDFETEFDTGGYDVYVVLSESVKLPTEFQERLDQEVGNGAGLLVAGNHDDRNNKLEDALGIHSTGKSLSVTGLSLDASGLVQAGGQANFPLDASPESVNKASADVVGSFLVSHGSAAPAVFSNSYGSGKAVYVAFDLALEEAAAGSGNLFDTLFTGALSYVHPATLTPYQGTVMPFVLTVTNTGVATQGQAVVTLPAGMSVVDPQTGTVSGHTLTWTFSMTQGQVLTLPFWAALPAQAGSVTVTAVVQSGTGSDLTTQATPSLVVGVQSGGHSVCNRLVEDRSEPTGTAAPKHGTDDGQKQD